MGFCDGIIYGEPGQLLFAPGHPQRVGMMSVNILNWLFLSRIVFIFLWFRTLYLYLVKLGFVFQTDWDQLSERSDRLGPPAHRKWSNWGSPPLSMMVMMVLLLFEMMMMVMLGMVMLMMVIGDDWWWRWQWWWWYEKKKGNLYHVINARAWRQFKYWRWFIEMYFSPSINLPLA